MRWLKRVAAGFLVFVFLFAVWIQIGSIDQDSFDDLGLLSELKSVSDADNGYLDIAYMGEDGFSFSGEKDLKSLSQGINWDDEKVGVLLLENKGVIDSVVASNKKSLFKFPEVHGVMESMFSYQMLTAANRMLIIQSRWYANRGDYRSAVDAINNAMDFSEHIRSEESAYLISWAVGLVMQGEVLAWVHDFSSNNNLTQEADAGIVDSMKKVRLYGEDGFRQVLIGEMKVSSEIIEDLNKGSLSKRISDYKNMMEFRSKFNVDDSNIDTKGKIFEYMNVIFPRFYLHANRANSIYAKHISSEVCFVNNYCNFRMYSDDNDLDYYYSWPENSGWLDLFISNSREVFFSEQISSNFYDYYQKRCHFHVYADGVRAALAVGRYQKDHAGTLPESLTELVPNYLDALPVDYFDGQPLRYSREKQWLYSVGADGKDDGGSAEGVYQGRCKKEEPCYNNPTIPLFVPLSQSEAAEKKEAWAQ